MKSRLAAMMVGREVLFGELRAGKPTDREVLTLQGSEGAGTTAACPP